MYVQGVITESKIKIYTVHYLQYHLSKTRRIMLNKRVLGLDLTVFPQVKSVRFEFHIDIQDLTIRFHKSRQYEIMY